MPYNIFCYKFSPLSWLSVKGLHFAPKELLPQLKLFQTRLLAKLCDLNMISSVHALWMFGSNHILEPEFGDALYEKALKEISNLRVCTVLSKYCFYCAFLFLIFILNFITLNSF